MKINKQQSISDNLFDYPAVSAGNFTTWASGGEIPFVSMKGPFPFANAMSSVTVSLNGTTQSISQPRNFMSQIAAMCASRQEADKCFESSYYEDSGGLWAIDNPGNKGKAAPNLDAGLERNESSWWSKALVGANKLQFDDTWGDAAGGTTLTYTEPLICSPFNPFYKMKGGIPSYLPWANMSDVVPNIDRLEIDIQFQKLAESVMFSRYLRSTTDNKNSRVVIQDLSADLLCYWYEVPQHMEIPRSIDLQSWMVREFNTDVAGLANGTTRDVDSQLIQLRSVPSLVLLTCIRNKDSASYDGTALTRTNGIDGDTPSIEVRDTMDYFCSFEKIEVILGDRPMVISSSFTAAELFYLTVKNSKYPFPYTQQEWLGKLIPRWTGPTGDSGQAYAAGDWTHQLSRMFIALRPKDLAERISDGVFSPTTLQFRTTVKAKSGFAGHNANAALDYRMYVHVFDSKSFLRIESDKAQFQLQSVSLEASRAATQPLLTQGAGLRVGGGLGGLGALRGRAAERYVPRIL